MNPTRIVFMGTAELACASLQALLDSPAFQVVATVTQPDRPFGRNLQLHASPVKELAQQRSLPILQPPKARHPDFLEELRALTPELIVVAAYGQILPATILQLPAGGCINVHASLLPHYRGAAPIQYSLLNGDATTGVTIMQMDVGMDTGPMLQQATLAIDPTDTSETLAPRLAALGASLLVETIPPYLGGQIVPRPQPAEGFSYAPKITKEQGRIDWSQSARVLHNKLRAFTPWPGLFTNLPGTSPFLLKIWHATVERGGGQPGEVLAADRSGIVVACGEEALRLTLLQREGRKRVTASEFLAGCTIAPGTLFS